MLTKPLLLIIENKKKIKNFMIIDEILNQN